jgi:hypothetical protein
MVYCNWNAYQIYFKAEWFIFWSIGWRQCASYSDRVVACLQWVTCINWEFPTRGSKSYCWCINWRAIGIGCCISERATSSNAFCERSESECWSSSTNIIYLSSQWWRCDDCWHAGVCDDNIEVIVNVISSIKWRYNWKHHTKCCSKRGGCGIDC